MKNKYNTYRIVRDGINNHIIYEKTYPKQYSEKFLRNLALRYMIDRDISTRYSFHIEYLNKEGEE